MMKALELDEAECCVLIDILNQKIRRLEAYRDTHEKYWCTTEAEILAYWIKLRDKILDFSYRQEMLDKED